MRNAWLLGFIAVLSVFFLFCVRTAQAYNPPPYDGLVNDFAQVLSSDFEAKLETQLQGIAAAADGPEVAVVTIPSLEGESVEQVSQDFFDSWKLGKADLDNGVLLLIAINDHQLRISTGYGVEPLLTDAEAGRIIRNLITPEFKKSDYEAGVQAGVDSILTQLQDANASVPASNLTGEDLWGLAVGAGVLMIVFLGFFLTIFAYVAAFLGRSKAWWPGGIAGGVLGLIFFSIGGAVIFALIGFILDYILSRNYKKWKLAKAPTSWRKTWGGFTHTSGGGGWSGGGFSSGGGSSGGGGASGGW